MSLPNPNFRPTAAYVRGVLAAATKISINADSLAVLNSVESMKEERIRSAVPASPVRALLELPPTMAPLLSLVELCLGELG